jgi:hypothetical protein
VATVPSIPICHALIARLVGAAERTVHKCDQLETGPAGSTEKEEILSAGRRTWKIPRAAAVRGAAYSVLTSTTGRVSHVPLDQHPLALH